MNEDIFLKACKWDCLYMCALSLLKLGKLWENQFESIKKKAKTIYFVHRRFPLMNGLNAGKNLGYVSALFLLPICLKYGLMCDLFFAFTWYKVRKIFISPMRTKSGVLHRKQFLKGDCTPNYRIKNIWKKNRHAHSLSVNHQAHSPTNALSQNLFCCSFWCRS